jgi:hypothetical protein
MITPAALRAAIACALFSSLVVAAEAPPSQSFPLATTEHVRPVGVSLSAAEHQGRRGVRVAWVPEKPGEQVAVLEGSSLRNGTIEAEISAQPAKGASEGARGFAGIVFRAVPDASRFECFYLRPTNGRADDQLRRNHSTQYIAHPGFPWEKLRKESPGVYESYVDLVPGDWTRVKVEVDGVKARLFVNGASQPALIVNDLKLGEGSGAVALWVGDETEAWFRSVKITPK